MKIFTLKIIMLMLVSNVVYSGDLKSNFIVAIDIGHSAKNQGAVSSRGVGEFYFNENMAKILLKKLQLSGFTNSFIIRISKGSKLKARTELASKKKADIYISIHHDSVQQKYIKYWEYKGKKNHFSDNFRGYSIFISKKNKNYKKSLSLAMNVGGHLRKNKFARTLHHSEKIKGENRRVLDEEKGVYEYNNLIVLKSTAMPAILLECGVIVNREEEVLLSNHRYQNNFIESVVAGISEYYLKWVT